MRDYAKSPVGIFDSGVGGLTVVKEVLRQLPGEDFVYLGDTARYPYGPRSVEIIKKFALQNARFLMGFGIKVLIVACNTASSVALDEIKRWIKIPVIGVIEPGAEEALKTTKNGKIGVIGTVGTISSGAYQEAIKRLNPGVSVYGKPCPLFVPLAEEGFTEGEIPEKVAHFYLDELVRQGIDTLVLGCTHYPLLYNPIKKVVGERVEIIDSAGAVVRKVKKFLEEENLLSSREHGTGRYFVTDSPERFARVGAKFLNKKFGEITATKVDL